MTVGREGFADLVAAADAIRARAATSHDHLARLELAGIGWATVELERAAREVGAEVGIDPAAWVPGTRDAVLGARAWIALAPGDGGPAIVLLEPDTEGRLAATLARFGEGVAAVYLRDPVVGASAPDRASATAAAQSALGPARLVSGSPSWGPHVLLLEPLDEGRTAMLGNR